MGEGEEDGGGGGEETVRPSSPHPFPADIFALTFPGHRQNSLPPVVPCQPPLYAVRVKRTSCE